MSIPENHLSHIVELIQQAGETLGSEYKLAKAMGIPQGHLSMWKAGTRTCTPEDRARIAAFAGQDAVQELVRATLEKNAGTRKGDQLYAALGKWLRPTGVAVAGALLAALSLIFGTITQPAQTAKAALDDVYYV